MLYNYIEKKRGENMSHKFKARLCKIGTSGVGLYFPYREVTKLNLKALINAQVECEIDEDGDIITYLSEAEPATQEVEVIEEVIEEVEEDDSEDEYEEVEYEEDENGNLVEVEYEDEDEEYEYEDEDE